MGTHLLIVKSITHAMSGQNILRANGIYSGIERNAVAVAKYGCGYGLRVKNKDLDNAVRILNANGIKIKEMFN